MHIPCSGGAQQNQPTTLFSQFRGMLATGEKSDVQALELKRHLILPAGKHHAQTPRSPAAPSGTGWRECPRDGMVGAVGRKERARLLTTAAVFREGGRPFALRLTAGPRPKDRAPSFSSPHHGRRYYSRPPAAAASFHLRPTGPAGPPRSGQVPTCLGVARNTLARSPANEHATRRGARRTAPASRPAS